MNQGTYLKEPAPCRLLKAENIDFYAHFHQQAEIVYCVDGQLPLLIDGIPYTLERGDSAVIFPNRRHRYRSHEQAHCSQAYLLLFYPSHTETFYSELTGTLPVCPIIKSRQLPDFFSQLWEQFYTIYQEQNEWYLFEAYAGLIAAHLLPQLTLEPIRLGSGTSGSALHSDEEAMQTVLNYISHHFRENITLTSTAKELGFSPCVLSHMFSDVIGSSFTTHVNTLRISYAKKLLRSSSSSVNEILLLSGFQSRRSFFRNFKEFCGQSPAEFRKTFKTTAPAGASSQSPKPTERPGQ